MAGRRLIDAAKLFNASKSVAKQHINLRSHQFDVYSKTSTLAKAVKDQTDRITLTAEAAIALSKRFNEAPPTYPTHPAPTENVGRQNGNTRRSGGIEGQNDSPRKDGSKVEEDGLKVPVEEEELPIKQEEAQRNPLPDGTIPPVGATFEEQKKEYETYTKRPSQEPPKEPLVERQGSEALEKGEGMRPVSSAASSIPLPAGEPHFQSETASTSTASEKSRKLQRQSESQIPSTSDEIQQPLQSDEYQDLLKSHDRDVFYTRSVDTKPEYSSLPRKKIPKHTEDAQKGDDHVAGGQINQDVYYSTPEPGQEDIQRQEIPSEVAVPEQDQVPEGVNTDVFRTARVARMLGGNPYAPKRHLDLKATTKTPLDHTKLSEGKDQDTFNIRQTEETVPAPPPAPLQSEQAAKEKEMEDFASELANDIHSAPDSKVNPLARAT